MSFLHTRRVLKFPEEKGSRAVVSNAFTAESSYDVFLSYNSADHGLVEDIARKLRDDGLELFLDRWNLAPGTLWRSKLEKTLGSSKAVAVCVGPGEMGSWQQREVDVALDLQSKSVNFPVIPVLRASAGLSSAIDLGRFANPATGPGNCHLDQGRPRRAARSRSPKELG